jgi:cytochrome c peroxidase
MSEERGRTVVRSMRRVAIAAYILLATACGSGETPSGGGAAPEAAVQPPAGPDPAALQAQAKAVFGTLPLEVPNPDNPFSEEKIKLGRMLYFDARLSKNHDVSCNSCHQLDRYGVDGEPTSPGHKGQRGERNSPTVYNAALHIDQFWDGRAADVEEQAKGPVLNPVEMAMPSEEQVIVVLRSIPEYRKLFRTAFPDGEDALTYDNMGRAIGAYERKLMTPSSFDAFLAGDVSALTKPQLVGLQTFIETGCITCHQGPALGGGMYRKLGLVKPYGSEDPGRFAVTGDEADRNVFKVPSLRNVVQTAPYFHDGSIGTLDEAIRVMAEHQLGVELAPEQVASIRAFLATLTGKIDPLYTAKPKLPSSGPDTPAADPS